MKLPRLAILCALLLLPSAPARAEKITITQYGRTIATLAWVVALEKNMFKEAGLDVDGITAGSGGGTTVRNVLASPLPFGEVSTAAALAAIKAGVDLVIIGAGSNHMGELVWASKAGSGITKVQDLKGKKVAYSNPKSATEMIIRFVLDKENLSKDVEALPMGGLGPGLTALAQGAIDAAPLNDPALTLTPEKFHVLFPAHQYVPKFTWAVDVTTRQFAEAHPDIVKKLMDVHRKSAEFIYQHPDEAAQIYAKVWEIDLKEAKALLPKYIEWRHWSPGDLSKDGLETMATCLKIVGEVDGPVDWSKYVDQRFLDDDLKAKGL